MNIEHNNEKIWHICDEMREGFHTSESKTRILALLMLKYLSENAVDGKVGTLTVPDQSSFESLFDKRDADDLSHYIDTALRAIEQGNQETVSDALSSIIFDDSSLGDHKKRNEILRTMIIELNSPGLNFRKNDFNYAGSAFEFGLAKFADIEKKHVDFTPLNISDLIAELAKHNVISTIHDPTCGTGMLLIKTANANGSNDIQLSGQELDETNRAIATMNAIVHGYDSCDFRLGNTLLNPQFTNENALQKFSCIVSFPPLIQKDWTQDDTKEYDVQHDPFNRFRRGIPPHKRSDWAFLSHIIESLDDHGRAYVIVPQGVLYRSSSAESQIRTYFIKEQLIEAIIILPTNTLHGTYIAPAIMILAKNNRKKSILFIDAASKFKKEKFRNVIGDHEIKDIASIYHDYISGNESNTLKMKNAYVATLEEIMEHDYSLSMTEYAKHDDDNATLDLGEIRRKIALKQEEYHAIQKERIALMKTLEKMPNTD
jgi:type I restriction enzyme M protein